VVKQLLKGTEWGKLDVLLLDMPPGTGDVQLTVCQEAQLSGGERAKPKLLQTLYNGFHLTKL